MARVVGGGVRCSEVKLAWEKKAKSTSELLFHLNVKYTLQALTNKFNVNIINKYNY